ncbi:hypothetical protein EAI_16181 [Harpegnathos saltator]|uniref:Protein NLRC3 n=1 Tax=Harpegnathos saltator TaxID=610380 RepID=E2B4J2_HARSA|nr:hypothetical protein EAI_16181 [Harpegnathos saltator]
MLCKCWVSPKSIKSTLKPLTAILIRNESLEILNISGCELSSAAGIALAQMFSSGCVKLEALDLDVSNNDFGPAGIALTIMS